MIVKEDYTAVLERIAAGSQDGFKVVTGADGSFRVSIQDCPANAFRISIVGQVMRAPEGTLVRTKIGMEPQAEFTMRAWRVISAVLASGIAAFSLLTVASVGSVRSQLLWFLLPLAALLVPFLRVKRARRCEVRFRGWIENVFKAAQVP